jgi:DNA-binding transcriptional LysR family regulator
VARLEQRVGVRLFDRSARAVALIEEERHFYALCLPPVAELAAGQGPRLSRFRPRGHPLTAGCRRAAIPDTTPARISEQGDIVACQQVIPPSREAALR